MHFHTSQVSGNSAIFTIPAVEAVITYKWNAFGRRLLLLELAVYLAWLMSFTGFTWLIQVGVTAGKAYTTRSVYKPHKPSDSMIGFHQQNADAQWHVPACTMCLAQQACS